MKSCDEKNGLVAWLEGLLFNMNTAGVKFDGTKSVAYMWRRSNKKKWAEFWQREKGSPINFLYYIVYKVFTLVPRKGFQNGDLASSFLAVLLTTNFVMLIFSLIRFMGTKIEKEYNLYVKMSLIAIYGCFYFFCKIYFLRKGNSTKIIEYYDDKFKNTNAPSIYGIIYMICTFSLFLLVAIYLNRFVG